MRNLIQVCELLGMERRRGSVLVYAPARGAAFYASNTAWKFLKALRGRVFALEDLPANQRSLVEKLGKYCLTEPPSASKTSTVFRFAPARLVLLPTADCNLRCRYCFSSGGSSTQTLNLDIAKAGVDYVLAKTLQLGLGRFSLTFHGGGEPTLAWNVLTDIHRYSIEQCAKAKIHFFSSLVTNCVWSPDKAIWIAKAFNRVTASFDGPKRVMDLHRLSPNGTSVFAQVARNVSALCHLGCQVGIRSTVSALNVRQLSESVRFFHSLGVRHVHFEQLTPSGRAKETGIPAPDAEEFIENFWRAYLVGQSLGIVVTSSHIRIDKPVGKYCTVLERSLCLTPDGSLTSCHRVSDRENPLWSQFAYGKFDNDNGSFTIDQTKVDRLIAESSIIPEECADCIARPHCTIGCYQHNAVCHGNRTLPDKARCGITKELTCRVLETRLAYAHERVSAN